MSTDVKRVWGKADSFALEFNYIGDEQWETTVPPDTKDGVYAVELWAINGAGELGHWTGELFMCSGVCCVRIFSQPYQIWFKAKKHQITIDKRLMIIFERGCAHVR